MAGLTAGIQSLGALQGIELAIYDRLIRSRPARPPDPRLLIVSISEADVRRYGRWPLSDRLIAQLLDTLQAEQPRTIGLDLVRDVDFPPGRADLASQLQATNVFGIQFLSRERSRRIAPPPELPPEQVGFSNVLLDPDGRVRRLLLFRAQDEQVYLSWNLQVARHYLAGEDIEPRLTADGAYQLGEAVLPRLLPTAGGYATIDASDYQLLLDYRRPEQVARTVSLSQVLAGNVPAEWIRDRIVMIGAGLPSTRDTFFTPYSGRDTRTSAQMFGVALQAQAVSQILTAALDGRAPLRYWPDWVEILWIASWALFGSFLAWRYQQPLVLMGVLLGAIALLAGVTLVLFQQQIWLPSGAPLLAFLASSGLMSLYAQQEARQQFSTVQRLLGQQTSPAIADALWQARDQLLVAGRLTGQTVTATVLFADIRDFSTIAEQRTADVLLAWLNEYLDAMTEAVVARGGLVNKFTGDGLMALFGVPVPRRSWADIAADAQQAVSSALAIGELLPALNARWQPQGWPPVQVRIGIYTGPVAVGSLGGRHRLEYGAIGDSVNVAARLQSCERDRQTDDCRVLVTRETLNYLDNHFPTEPWGELALKGRQHSVAVFRVLPQSPPS